MSLTLFLLAVCFLSPPLFFVRLLSCVAFYYARVFNADISKWQTGAVTNMVSSEYTNHAVVTFVEFSEVLFLSLTLLLAVCSLSPPVFFVLLFSCVAFFGASAFNADLSKWQTGAVTNMDQSEYTDHMWLPYSNFHQCSLFTHSFSSWCVFSFSTSVFCAVAFLCSFFFCMGIQCGYIQVADRCCHKSAWE